MASFAIVCDTSGVAGGILGDIVAQAKASGLPEMTVIDCGAAAFAMCGTVEIVRADGIVLIADARIDDRLNIERALGLDAGAAATDIILAAWRRWGTDAPRHLLGEYVFAIYDERAETLFVTRDHVGTRPCFYGWAGRRFVAASEIPLVLAGGVPDAIDEAAVATKLVDRPYSPTARTFISAVRRLPAAHHLTVQKDTASTRRYWSAQQCARVRYPRREDYVERLRDLMATAVRDRLEDTSHPIGVHVSGGLDCSSIAALAVDGLRARGRPDPIGFSWIPLPDEAVAAGPELGWVGAVQRYLGIEIEAPWQSSENLVRLFKLDFTRAPDAGNLFHEDAVQRAAAHRGVRTILSGWGGDEGVSYNGRGLLPEMLMRGRWLWLYRHGRQVGVPTLRLFARTLRNYLREAFKKDPHRLPVRSHTTLADPAFLNAQQRYPNQRGRDMSVAQRLRDGFADGHIEARLEDWAIHGARHGVAYRYPLLDRRLLEFALGIPHELFVDGDINRWLMRAAVEPLLPPEIVRNPSKDEPTRIATMLGPMRDACHAIADELDARTAPPVRATWLDMERVNAELRSGLPALDEKGSPKIAALRLALQFLDI